MGSMVGSNRSEFRLNGAIGDKKLVTNCANGFVGSQKTTPKKIFFGTGGVPVPTKIFFSGSFFETPQNRLHNQLPTFCPLSSRLIGIPNGLSLPWSRGPVCERFRTNIGLSGNDNKWRAGHLKFLVSLKKLVETCCVRFGVAWKMRDFVRRNICLDEFQT